MLMSHRRELSVAAAIMALGLVLAVAAPAYFSAENLSDLFLANLPVLLVAIGMTLVIVTGEIDISVGSVFAICGVAAGILSKAGMPIGLAGAGACLLGAAFGSLNGALVAYVGIPSIVVTLATMTALRDGLRWATEGAKPSRRKAVSGLWWPWPGARKATVTGRCTAPDTSLEDPIAAPMAATAASSVRPGSTTPSDCTPTSTDMCRVSQRPS